MASNLERRAENLAFVLQELLTVGERLRAGRQAVQDAASFRQQLREALKLADQEARKRGYTSDDTQLATFAVVAFLDESILNLRNPIFADWPKQPLQEELFGHHVAGEIFFQNLQKIMGRNDSQETADLLEVYYLCLLLGFAGRYSLSGRGELKGVMDATGDKIRRIRQLPPDLSPWWALPGEPVRAGGRDPWVKRLLIGAIACVALALVLFVGFKFSLGSRISALEQSVSHRS
ncbi:MAG: DotU family type IV/VI secretion system protein [Acidobacteria bacterium]|nr:DotU family type IV/VI secretion system protein [Acidobacteriota bacterium]MBI3278977.1 DotU family type IV/VI secretion system protein [Acidobacteriota bacterium]